MTFKTHDVALFFLSQTLKTLETFVCIRASAHAMPSVLSAFCMPHSFLSSTPFPEKASFQDLPILVYCQTALSPHLCALYYISVVSICSDHNVKYSSFPLLGINTIGIIRVVGKDLCAGLLMSVLFYSDKKIRINLNIWR